MALSLALKRIAARLAARLGYAVIPKWQLQTFALAHHLRMLFDICQVDCVIDVGANRGQYGRFLRDQVGWVGPILSFEPVDVPYGLLAKESAADPLWRCYRVALGPTSGRRHINVMSSDRFSSFLSPREVSWFAGTNVVVDTEDCAVARLDEWTLEHALPYRRCYLKLDTQGYDLAVLDGAAGTLEKIAALQSEVSFVPIYQDMPDFRRTIDRAAELGFVVSNIFPVTIKDGIAVEFDCVFIRRRGR